MNRRLNSLIREPALIIDLAETLVVLLVAFGLGLSGDQQTYIVAAVIAALGLAKAFTTRPFAVAAVTDFGRVVLTLAMSFGVGLNANQIALLVTFLGTVTTLIMRAQITPASDPIVAQAGSGAGPVSGSVRNEAGQISGAVVTGIVVIVALIVFFALILPAMR